MRNNKLLDDDAQEFLLPRTKKKVDGLAKVNILSRIFDCSAINFNCLLLNQPFRFCF